MRQLARRYEMKAPAMSPAPPAGAGRAPRSVESARTRRIFTKSAPAKYLITAIIFPTTTVARLKACMVHQVNTVFGAYDSDTAFDLSGEKEFRQANWLLVGNGKTVERLAVCMSKTSESRRVVEFASKLRRQDSNLNSQNQNLMCCRLHHDGSVRPAVKPRPL
jgi:hypothetical protein